MSVPQRIAVETQYLAAVDLEELTAATRTWADVVALPPRAAETAYRDLLGDAAVVIGSPRPQWIKGTSIRFLQLAGTGYEDFLDVDLGDNRNLAICNARGVYSIGIAEHVVALMLAFCRDVPYLLSAQQGAQWSPRYDRFGELTGQTAVIVGLGDVGSEIAKRASGMGMTVVAVRRRVNSEAVPPYVSEIVPSSRMHDALRRADHVILALPGGPDTRNLIDGHALAQIKPGAFLYNVGRGTTIDQSELIQALIGGRLAGAGLDVFASEPLPSDSPLWKMPQVIVTPHVAGYSTGCVRRFGRLVIDNVQRFHDGKPLRNQIPAADLIAHAVIRR